MRCKFVRSIVIIQDGCEYLEASLIKRDASSFEALLSFKMVVSTWKRHSSNAMQVVRSIVIIQDGCEYLVASLIKRDASSFEALLSFKMGVKLSTPSQILFIPDIPDDSEWLRLRGLTLGITFSTHAMRSCCCGRYRRK